MIKIVHFSDLHFGAGERYGSLNPETALNKRFEDFISALDKPINFAIENKVDLVIFTGDTYKNATPEPVYQREFAKRVKRLSLNKIPTILLVGNHDILYKADGSDSLDIYSTLGIDYVTVLNKIGLQNIETPSGIVQIISLPHITKSRLLTKNEYRELGSKEQDKLMLQKIKQAIDACIQKLNPDQVAILLGHGVMETAEFGSEQDLSIGKVLSYPLTYFQAAELDYVGFGHIHRHQVLQKKKPLILYAGSLERVDFSEENEDKGFVYLELAKGGVRYEFISTQPRKFITISCDLTSSENPQLDLEKNILLKEVAGAIVRVRYKVQEGDFSKIDQEIIRSKLVESFAYIIQAEIACKERTFRIGGPDLDLTCNPLSTLEKYLFDYTEEEKNTLLEKAKGLIESL